MGRKRLFATEEVLETAMTLFWEKGYEGLHLDELTELTGITRPSLYSVFGSKAGLFRQALRRYEDQRLSFMRQALEEGTVRAVIVAFLGGVLALVAGSDTPKGTLHVNVALTCSAVDVRRLLADRQAACHSLLRRRFEKGWRDGDLDRAVSANMLAHLILMVGTGLAVQARARVPRENLESVFDMALSLMPVGVGR